MYRFLILSTLLFSLIGCSTVMIDGDVTSDQGTDLGPVHMETFKNRGLKKYSIRAEFPDETVFKGEINFGEKTTTLFTDNGVSMKCDFEMNTPEGYFENGGTGVCTTSDGQKLKVKF
ncbi:hypothetical protein [Maridesulfovibrio zosterae]|uniref:hypothetical protein n=1 Tax=Maridesulfovibrio zosterae TaxID=82171 RepID=UPI0003F8E421|nr:hypothetical protein [Maridesulfovibrio zosterae]